MYTLISFLGSIGNLTNVTSLDVLLNSAFSGIPNMINGKTWPEALIGFTIVVTLIQKDS